MLAFGELYVRQIYYYRHAYNLYSKKTCAKEHQIAFHNNRTVEMKFKKIGAIFLITIVGFFVYHLVCVNKFEEIFQQFDDGQISISIHPLTNHDLI